MTNQTVTVRLNQQQLELVDNTIERGVASSREELFKKALREYRRSDSPDEELSSE